MIYDITPSEFIDGVHYQYTDLFDLPLIAPPSSIFMYINVTDRYVGTSIHVDTEIGTVRYRNTTTKT